MTLFKVWLLCALLIPLLHLLPALIIDRRLSLGTWTRIGLALFVLLGPLGLLLECWLLGAVLADIAAQNRNRPGLRRRAPVPILGLRSRTRFGTSRIPVRR